MKKQDWLNNEIEFYDFIWREGTELCENHVNSELMADFAKGGNLFEEMKAKILQKFPSREKAYKSFIKSLTPPTGQERGT